jgi:Glycoside hydrolase 123 N-terminal domain/Glycoside hydrolase 123, catalytic domain
MSRLLAAFRNATTLLLVASLFATVSAADNESVVIVDPLVEVRTAADVQPVGKVVRLVAPQNGVSSASVVKLGKSSPARISELKSGDAAIPADRVQIRYASKDKEFTIRGTGNKYMFDKAAGHPLADVPYFDILNDAPQNAGDVHPIWVTVAVPAAAKPGMYKGQLTVGDVKLPVELTVSAYALPHPREWVAHAGIDSSPEIVAHRYKVERWSDAHWKLVEGSIQFAQALGNDELLIPITPQKYGHYSYSHDRSWIDYSNLDKLDFSVVEKYVELFVKVNGGPPKYLVLDIWRSKWFAGKKAGDAARRNTPPGGPRRPARKVPPMKIVNIDGEAVMLPGFNTPEGEKLWIAIFEHILAICQKHKIDRNAIIIGLASDTRPTEEATAFFKKIAPYARWQLWTHGRGEPVPTAKTPMIDARFQAAVYVHPYLPSPGYDRIDCLLGGWDDALAVSASARNGLYTCAPLTHWRAFPSGVTIATRHLARTGGGGQYRGNGVAHVPLDYWPVKQKPWETYYNFASLFRNNSRYLTAPGPTGHLGTVRYEMLREGLQELEARIVVEKGIMSKQLPKDLDAKVRDFMKDYIKNLYGNKTFRGGHYSGTLGKENHLYKVARDWQRSTATMFQLAGQMQRAGVK